jgi:ubiquitin C-terminal hydrolase
VQCLSHTSALNDLLLSNEIRTILPKNSLVETYCQLVELMFDRAGPPTIRPWEFRSAVMNLAPSFRGGGQHDTHEFLCFMLDHFCDDIKSVQKLFTITATQTTQCNNCNEAIKQNVQHRFFSLPLDITSQTVSVPITELFRNYFIPEPVSLYVICIG